MKKVAVILILLAAGYLGFLPSEQSVAPVVAELKQAPVGDQVTQAYERRARNLQLTLEGRVTKILPDDRDGSRHQRFIIRVDSGRTLLVAHNIDLAPRINGIKAGDRVQLHGVYEWNEKGGVVHWTHHDPQGRHEDGWIRHKGQVYQ